MDAVKFLKEKYRMCDKYNCESCPMLYRQQCKKGMVPKYEVCSECRKEYWHTEVE